MNIRDEIIRMIENTRYMPVQVSEQSNLYSDLGFSSLEFINFLVNVENTYSIFFDITEIMLCLQVKRLINLVEIKTGERKENA